MRLMKKMSPTALHKWEEDREEFYVRYLSDSSPPRPPQSAPMSVGSAFDAFVKHELCKDFYPELPAEFELETLFNEQVEEDCRSFAWTAGKHCYERYRSVGAYADLCVEIGKSKELPQFEYRLQEEISGVPLQGKPDLGFPLEVPFIHDWKVNGYCSKSPTSPRPYHMMCRDTWHADEFRPTRGGDKPHKKFKPMEFGGTTIGSHWMEDVNKKWADQVTIYAWMTGIPVGSEDWIASIDQLACRPNEDGMPLIRVAQHRCRVSAFWQFNLLNRLKSCWSTIQSGHIFTHMSREESDARCETLDMQIHDNDEFWSLVAQKGY